MTAAFSSWSAFFAMGGYAFHVWTSVLIVVGSMLMLTTVIYYQGKKSERAVRRKMDNIVSASTKDEYTQ